ncbi:MAG TPA: filamentous hemagglutinin family protein, partial [Myxococcales bacterium]|nr:filamentous hemagglutinin family protein [Myxococcales bacterium]
LEDHFGQLSTLSLAPAGKGTLEVLAMQDVHLALTAVRLEDVAAGFRRGPLDAFSTLGDSTGIGLISDPTTNFLRGFDPRPAGDPDPLRIYAAQGSVCAQRSGACTPDARSLPTQVTAPKPMDVFAGQDVMAGTWQSQNNGPGDISVLRAGRDLYEVGLQATGEGSALLEAGRSVLLNQYGTASKGGSFFGLGNRTDQLGQRLNQALPAGKGADVYVLAGTANGVDYDAFAAVYLDPSNAHHVPRTYLPELAAYMKELGFKPMADADLVAAFRTLPLARREIFLDRVYFAELKQTGIDYNDPASPRFHSYQRGFRAISTLFSRDPSTIDSAHQGDVILNSKSFETQTDGDLNILAPYGHVAVGADVLPASVDPTKGGLVTRRGGSIRVMSDGNIDLFTSRVFTLEGGDITLWTSDGSITAGAGSKTSVFQKPLTYTMDNAAVVAVDAFGLQTGAGIGVLDALDNSGDRPRSRLDLIAPRGEVNAGDAGIRVVGDINIAAQAVVGVENIQVSGSAAGVPKVEAPNVAALTSASQVAQAAAKEGVGPEAQPRTAVADLPSIITVEVLGYETEAGDDASERKKKGPPDGK